MTDLPTAVYCCTGHQLRAEAKRVQDGLEFDAPVDTARVRGLMFVQDATSGAICITLASDYTNKAMGRLQAGNPAELTLRLLLVGAGKPQRDALHGHFATRNVRGEWFQATPELLEAMRWLAANGRKVREHRLLEGIERLFGVTHTTRLEAEREWEAFALRSEVLREWCPARAAAPVRRRKAAAQ